MKYVDYYEILRQNIKRYRKLNNLTQEELAKRVKCSKGTISNIESNKYKSHVSLELYCYIGEALCVSIVELLEPNFEEVYKDTLPILNINNNKYKTFNYDIYYENIILNINSWRKSKLLSQELLAEKADLSTNFISDIINKKTGFTIETIGKIAYGLNIDIRTLFK